MSTDELEKLESLLSAFLGNVMNSGVDKVSAVRNLVRLELGVKKEIGS